MSRTLAQSAPCLRSWSRLAPPAGSDVGTSKKSEFYVMQQEAQPRNKNGSVKKKGKGKKVKKE
jgi:hypothetical protein